MNDNGIATEQAANDNRRALRLVVLCATGCGHEAVYDGYCDDCIADANAYLDERREAWEGERV